MTPFSSRIHDAIDVAARAHEGHVRKDPDVRTPYITHAVGVAFLLAEHGFAEHVVIAGLFHDVLEDQPESAGDIERFGRKAVALVEWVSEEKKRPDGAAIPWSERKAAMIDRMRGAPADAKAISCADAVHNMQSLLLAVQRGVDPWPQLGATPPDQVARLEKLREALGTGWDHPLLARYDDLLIALRESL